MNHKNLKKALGQGHPDIVVTLKKIAEIGIVIRDERNSRAHKGFIDLMTDDDQMFKNIAWAEIHGGKAENYNIDEVYQDAARKIYERLIEEVGELLTQISDLLDRLIPEFKKRYSEKRCEVLQGNENGA